MDVSALLPDSTALRLEEVTVSQGVARLVVSSTRRNGVCPSCGQSGARIHSHYQRKLQDLPWQGITVSVLWRSRKFFCDTLGCPRQVFTERLPLVAAPYARRTSRLSKIVAHLGIALGGEAGRRLAAQLGISASADTLLRSVRRMASAPVASPRVIGVDDWAMWRGHRYGSIIVDLERHRPIELLPDRQWETLGDWLRAHPSVEIISRDRADCYARGAASGAPQATQVVDRFHLLQNLREALKRTADTMIHEVQAAAKEVAFAQVPCPSDRNTVAGVLASTDTASNQSPCQSSTSTRTSSRSRRLEWYRQVHELHHRGESQRAIAGTLGLSRKTVRRMLSATTFPERAARPAHRNTDPYLDHLKRRWRDGCRNARVLFRELVERGFKGSEPAVRRTVAVWRVSSGTDSGAGPNRHVSRSAMKKRPSSRQVSWLLFLPAGELDADERRLLDAIHRQAPPLVIAGELAREFRELVKSRQSERLSDWITRASGDSVPPDIRRFAQGLRADLPTMEASVKLPWSNGQVEGQVN